MGADTHRKDTTAKAFILTSAFWMTVATFYGLLGATELIAPDMSANIGAIVFGRVRPTHVNLVLLGFVTPGLLGAAFFFIPRLLSTRLFSEKLGVATAAAWNLNLIALVVTLAMGRTQGREYAELIWPLVCCRRAGLFADSLESPGDRFPSSRADPLRFRLVCAGGPLSSPPAPIHWANVIWRPDSGALVGIPDAILLWFYGHNVFGLLLTPLSAAVAYYVIPRATGVALVQPHPFPAGILGPDRRLHPYRHPSPAPGAGAPPGSR